MFSRYSPTLIMFYTVCLIVFTMIFYIKKRLPMHSFLLAFLTVLLGSEYYEVPLVIAGYFRLFNFGFPFWQHHLFLILLSIIFVQVSEIKWSQKEILVVLLGPILTAPLLLLTPISARVLTGYIARIIGLTLLGGIIYFASPLVR